MPRQLGRSVAFLDQAQQQMVVPPHHQQLESHRDDHCGGQHRVHHLTRARQRGGHRAQRYQQHRQADAAHRGQAIAEHQRAERHDRGVVDPRFDRCACPAGDAPHTADRGGEQAQLPHRGDDPPRILGGRGVEFDRARQQDQAQRGERQHRQRQPVGDQRPRTRARPIGDHRQAEDKAREQQPRLADHVVGSEHGEVVPQMRGNARPAKAVQDASPKHPYAII